MIEKSDLEVIVKNSLSAKDIKNELVKSNLAIVPASGILFEVISIGLPVISGFYTANQMAIYKGFLKKRYLLTLFPLLKKHLLMLLKN